MSRRPSEESIRRAIVDVLARLDPPQFLNKFRKLTGGYANLVYNVNDSYVLRVFFRKGWEANFASERVALEMLQSVLKVPRVITSGDLELEWSCPFLLLNQLPGREAGRGFEKFQ